MPVTLSQEDQKSYDQMVHLLHSLTYALTTRFVRDPARRKQILHRLYDTTTEMTRLFGCGDLCPSKEKGCASCD